MAIHSLKRVQKLPISLQDAWHFFSSPKNLPFITPPSMDFKILSGGDQDMFAGQIIMYTLKPLLNIPASWTTEITHVKEGEYFVDEQRSGPYSLWHHAHFFKAIEGGVEMTDLVHYKVPLGFLGDIMNVILVKRKLTEIFDFRFEVLEKKFGRMPA